MRIFATIFGKSSQKFIMRNDCAKNSQKFAWEMSFHELSPESSSGGKVVVPFCPRILHRRFCRTKLISQRKLVLQKFLWPKALTFFKFRLWLSSSDSYELLSKPPCLKFANINRYSPFITRNSSPLFLTEYIHDH